MKLFTTGIAIMALLAMSAPHLAGATGAIENDKEFQSEISQDDSSKVLLFSADWCGYCHKIKPSFNKVAQDYAPKADFFVVNFDGAEQARREYGVKYLPTMIFIENGEEVDRIVGYTGERKIRKTLEKSFQN